MNISRGRCVLYSALLAVDTWLGGAIETATLEHLAYLTHTENILYEKEKK
jgi:hypothetical protein